jgi:hypothetical protein
MFAVRYELSVTTDGVWIDEWSAIANLHNSQINTTPAKPFLACCVFITHSLAAASSSGDSSVSLAQVFSSQPAVQNCLTTDLVPCL